MSEETEQLEARIAAYIDGELPEAEAARLEILLANSDPKLAEKVIGMLGDKQRLRGLPKAKAPPDLAAHVMEQLERATLLHDVEHLSHRRNWWQSRAAIAAGVALVIGGFSWLVFHSLVRPGIDHGWGALTAKKQDEKALPGSIAAAPAVEGTRRTIADKAGESAWAGAARSTESIALAPPAPAAPLASAGPGIGGGMKMKADGDRSAALFGKAASGKAGAVASDAAEKIADENLDDLAKSEQIVQEQLANGDKLVQNGEGEAARFGFVRADTATKALASVAMNGSRAKTEPIVVTLVERTSEDPAKLRGELMAFMADPDAASRQRKLQTRYAGNTTLANDLYTGNTTVTGGTIGNSGSLSANNDNSVNGTANQVAANLASNNPTGNNDGYIIVNRQGGFDQVTGLNNKSRVANQSNPVAQDSGNVRFNDSLAAPYRVMLREDQLQKLTGDFRVYSLSCGTQAFVIAPPPAPAEPVRVAEAKSPKTYTTKSPADHEQPEANFDAQSNSKMSASAAATTPAKPEGATSTIQHLASLKDQKKESTQMEAQQVAPDLRQEAPGRDREGQAAQAHAQAETRWLDCVIKMEPRPAQANAAEQQKNSQMQSK